MGLFSSLLGGSKTKVSAQQIPFQKKLPKELQAPAIGLAKSALGRFQDITSAGETPEAASLFGAARARTIKDFRSASRGLSSGLIRAGVGGSTASRRGGIDLANALLGQLTLLDTQRSEQLAAKQFSGAQAGIGGIASLAGAGTTIPIVQQGSPGLFGSVLGAVGGALGGSLGGGIASSIGGLFGGGARSGGGTVPGTIGGPFSQTSGFASSLFGGLPTSSTSVV